MNIKNAIQITVVFFVCAGASNEKELNKYFLTGHALGVVDLYDVVKNEEDGDYKWLLRDPIYITPFPVRGMPGFFEIEDEKISILLRPDGELFDADDEITFLVNEGYLDEKYFI